MQSDFLEHNAKSLFNRDAFFINYLEEFFLFEDIYTRLNHMSYLVSQKKDDQDNFMDLLTPFLAIILKQSIMSFDYLTRYNISGSWIVFRPALESMLCIGKFLDDWNNFTLWRNKKEIYRNRKSSEYKQLWKKYQKEFEGEGLAPKSLPYGKCFRQLFSRINDEWMHTNFDYIKNNILYRAKDNKEIIMDIIYTGASEADIEAHLYSFLHIYYLMVTSLGKGLSSRYSNEKSLNIDIENIERWKPKVEKLIQGHPDLKDFCNTFGLWDI